MKKYKADIYSDNLREVEVISESDKFVIFPSKRKAAKETAYDFIADKPIDAAKWLVNKLQKKHDESIREFSYTQKKLAAAIDLQKSIEAEK